MKFNWSASLRVTDIIKAPTSSVFLLIVSMFLAEAPAISIAASGASASPSEPVPSKLHIPPQNKDGQLGESPTFKGSGIWQFDYHVSAIKPEPPSQSTSGGLPKTGVVHTLPNPISEPQSVHI